MQQVEFMKIKISLDLTINDIISTFPHKFRRNLLRKTDTFQTITD